MNAGTSFGLWLKQRRKALDLTQQDLAKRVDCSLQTIVKIEAGERKPSKQVAERLADCLSIPATERPAFVLFARADPATAQHGLLSQAGASQAHAPWRALQHRHLASHDNNLPAQINPFVGREKQVMSAANLLRRPGVRLLSMTGPPGIGKTRLALQVAAEMLPEFEGGVYVVPLAAVRDPRMVVSAVAQTMGVREAARRPLLESLKNYLRDKHMLLVLDNFEQVAAAGPAVIEMLEAARWLKGLVTSRAALHLYGEYELRIPPLSLPASPRREARLHKRASSIEQLAEYEAVELFVERALAVRPDFALSEDNAPVVAEICRRLDGLPLAIELAAARIKFLPPQTILGRLESAEPGARLRLLAGGAKNLPARPRTLRGAIAWSYDLLDPGEQALFRRLAVFVGGCPLEAVEQLLDSGGRLPPESNMQDLLASLVDKNLLRSESGPAQEAEGGAGAEREPRYVMLETIREYGLERLEESGEEQAVSRRHAEYYLALSERAEPELRGPRQAAWLDRLEAEHDNLRAALRWAEEAGEVEVALRMAGVLGWFWFRRGYISEGRERLAGALGQARAARLGPTGPLAKAFNAAGRLADHQGDNESARALYRQSLAIYEELGDPQGAGYTLSGLAFTSYREGNRDEARSYYERSLAMFREMGPRGALGVATTVRGLGDVALSEGDYDLARSRYTESLGIFRDLGDKYSVATLLNGLGNVALDLGDYAPARSLYEEGLAIFQELGYKYGVAGSLLSLGEAARCLADYEAACSLNEQSLKLWRDLGDKWNMAMTMHNLGHAVHHLGDPGRAGAIFVESLALFQEAGAKMGIAMCLAGLAGVAGAWAAAPARGNGAASLSLTPVMNEHSHGRPGYAERAARLFGAAETLLEQIGASLQAADLADYERNLAAVRSQLTERKFAAARQEGRAMTPEQAIAYALE
jgi:predicted ATPase/DNA-binding XRE family transcriptional regulator